MKIGTKVAGLVGTLIATQVVSLGVAGGLMLQAQENYQQVLDDVVLESNLADGINREYREQSQAWLSLQLHANRPTESAADLREVRRHAMNVEADILALRSSTNDERLLTRLDKFENKHNEVTNAMESAAPSVLDGTFDTQLKGDPHPQPAGPGPGRGAT